MKSKIKNIVEKTLYVILGIAAVAGITFGCYKLYNSLFKVEVVEAKSNWNDLPTNFKEFSMKNSYKVSLKISETKASNGTCWSWYWKQQTNSPSHYDWYLITNFHVVNEAVAYNQNLTMDSSNNSVVITDNQKLIDAYQNNYIFSFDRSYWDYSDLNQGISFNLSQWVESSDPDQQPHYESVLIPAARSRISALSIITDFENDNIDLFSKLDDTQKNVQAFNLDMAIIKITFNFSGLNQSTISIPKWSPILNYRNGNSQDALYNDNLKMFIAGNPAALQKLVGVEIASKFTPDYKNLETIDDLILKKLKAPYLYSLTDYLNFPLSAGASGSAVYQDASYPISGGANPTQPIDWTSKIPVGIYWGGQSTNKVMKPSFIPFITNTISTQYNIFDNFWNAITQNKI